MYIIKTSYGAYINQDSSSNELNYCMTSLEYAKKYSMIEILSIYKKFKDKWNRDKFEVHKVELVEVCRIDLFQ